MLDYNYNLALNVSRGGASTASLGNLCFCSTTLIVKTISSCMNLPLFDFKPLPWVLSQEDLLKSQSASFL